MPYTPRTTLDIFQALAAKVIARTELTDLSEGSALGQLLATVAEEMAGAELRIQALRDGFHVLTATGEYLDERAAELPGGGLSRHAAIPASGAVMTIDVEAAAVAAGPYVLPAGQVFGRSQDGTQTYRTTADVTFPLTVTQQTGVPVVAVVAGSASNCSSGEIDRLISVASEVVSATNAAPLTNGQDAETDDALRERLVAYLSSLSRCTRSAQVYAALAFVDSSGARARFASLYEDPARPGYTELIVDNGSGFFGLTAQVSASTGTAPSASPVSILSHPAPATRPIEQVTVTYAAGGQGILTHAGGDYTSLHERGIVILNTPLSPGDQWEIGAHEVYTGFVAELQQEIEGSASQPLTASGWRAAGTRVVVQPAVTQLVELDVHVVPAPFVPYSDVTAEIAELIELYVANLAPGETLRVSRMYEAVLAGNDRVDAITAYVHGSATALPDQPAKDARTAIRTRKPLIHFVPAQE